MRLLRPGGSSDADPGILEYKAFGRRQVQSFGCQQVYFRVGLAAAHPVAADDAGEVVGDTAVAEDEIDVLAAA